MSWRSDGKIRRADEATLDRLDPTVGHPPPTVEEADGIAHGEAEHVGVSGRVGIEHDFASALGKSARMEASHVQRA